MPSVEMPLPARCTAVAIICDTAARQLTALAQAHSRTDLVCEIPRLKVTAANAVKLALDSLRCLLGDLQDQPTRRGRK
jgi:hypothetical protein